ncbi:MAG: calcium-binding protein [Sulfurimonas sp.]|uniref:calcium-binding protein n=1 Tax=Sulfurimonas sp. TaxID=2022749 RepID=UPI003D0F0806
MYTLTIKIAAGDTKYTNKKGESHLSDFGHMWYSISNGGTPESYGFAPKDGNLIPFHGDGEVSDWDDDGYQWTYYTGQIVITSNQYNKLTTFGKDPTTENFSMTYDGTYNSCIDFTWKALNLAGFNPSNFDGNILPDSNADDADKQLYKYLMGNLEGWDSSQPKAGDYHAIYGSNENDVLRSDEKTDAVYGGAGNDDIYGNDLNQNLYGGVGNDFIDGHKGNDYIDGGEGDDDLIGFDGNDVIYGGIGSDTLFGGDDNDYLNGGTGSDTMEGGEGFDTYIADSGDTISDDDGLGEVFLGGEHLDGGEKETIKHIEVTTTNFTKTFIYCECETVTEWSEVETDEWLEEEEFYVDKATGTKYILNGSSLRVIASSGSITINNFSDGDLGINLSETESIDKKEITKEVFLEEDFCSPLVLDLNGNGTNSTRLNESTVYFDMDGDGFKERTAWVENGDGLLVLDKNANGVIDNGSELFGNFTALADGNNADDGFSALLQHDENKDGKIDKNDAIYNQLNVWVDANQDGILNTQDEAFNYVLLREDDNGGVTLFIPQVDNQIKEAA